MGDKLSNPICQHYRGILGDALLNYKEIPDEALENLVAEVHYKATWNKFKNKVLMQLDVYERQTCDK